MAGYVGAQVARTVVRVVHVTLMAYAQQAIPRISTANLTQIVLPAKFVIFLLLQAAKAIKTSVSSEL